MKLRAELSHADIKKVIVEHFTKTLGLDFIDDDEVSLEFVANEDGTVEIVAIYESDM